MVSDRPFRGPQPEKVEEADFSGLGLLGDLVDAMDEFGESRRSFMSLVCVRAAACCSLMWRLECFFTMSPHVSDFPATTEKGGCSCAAELPWVF